MSEYSAYELQRWIRAGMPESRSPYTNRCECCGERDRTDTGNWSFCKDKGDWHGPAAGKKK